MPEFQCLAKSARPCGQFDEQAPPFPEDASSRRLEKNKPLETKGLFYILLAETEGFEPSMQVLPACSLSRGKYEISKTV